MRTSILLLLLFGWLAAVAQAPLLTRIAFGSCSNEELPEEMWTDMAAQQPQLCILLGDNIYGDTHDMASMRAQYEKQKNLPGYQLLLKTCPVIGTWDDHDYGQNDAGKNYRKKKESKDEFMRFFDIAADDPIRSHEGVYSSRTYGPTGKRVKVILLDVRYFRDTTIRSTQRGRRYDPNPDGDMLGEEQWAWFENEIRNSDADIHLIGSGIQFIADEHGYEKWANFPKSRQRMLDLLVKHKPRKVLFLSGDRHIAEILRMDVPGLGQPLYDFTSSGLTHTWNVNAGMPPNEPSKYRVSRFIIQKNFGMVRIDWSGPKPVIRLEIRGKSNALWDEPVEVN